MPELAEAPGAVAFEPETSWGAAVLLRMASEPPAAPHCPCGGGECAASTSPRELSSVSPDFTLGLRALRTAFRVVTRLLSGALLLEVAAVTGHRRLVSSAHSSHDPPAGEPPDRADLPGFLTTTGSVPTWVLKRP